MLREMFTGSILFNYLKTKGNDCYRRHNQNNRCDVFFNGLTPGTTRPITQPDKGLAPHDGGDEVPGCELFK